MSNRPIRWFFPQFGENEKNQVIKVLESNYINDGKVTLALEEKIAKMIGSRYCVAVTSGTAAITLGLMALGVGPGDEVIVPDMTFIATANAVRLTGASVKLVDIEPIRFSIDLDSASKAIGPKTKALIAVDVNGRGAQYELLEPFCKKHGLALLCDSAEALGSQYNGRYLGTYGDVGCFSFSANKTISSGQGGMIVTDRIDLYHRFRELKDQGRRFGGTGGDDLHPVMGFNFKYTNLQAAVALAQLDRIAERIAHFQKRDEWYSLELQGCPQMILPPLSTGSGEVRQWTDILCKDRARLEAALKRQEIEFRPFWFPLHTQKPYLLPDEGFENSVEISKTGLWLPSSFELSREDVAVVCKVIREEFGFKNQLQEIR